MDARACLPRECQESQDLVLVGGVAGSWLWGWGSSLLVLVGGIAGCRLWGFKGWLQG